MADQKQEKDGVSSQNIKKNGGKVSILRSFKLVAWSFLGVRQKSEYEKDLHQVSPLHVIGVGLLLALLFIGVLLLVVWWVVP